MGVDHKYEINPVLTGMALKYQTPEYNLIADSILPRVPATGELFKYRKYKENSFLKVPDTEVGRMGTPKGVGIESELKTESVNYHATKEQVPMADVEAATDGADPIKDNTELAVNSLVLAREARVAKLLQTSSFYGNNTTTLTDGEHINEADSSPLKLVQDIRKKMLVKPNCAVMTEDALTYLQTHPDFTASYNGTASTRGMAPVDFVKKLLKVQEILIGEVYIDFSKNTKSDIQNVWGNNIVLFYKNPQATLKTGLTFGLTAEFEKRTVSTYFDPDPGVSGVMNVKAAEKIKELILAPSCGWLIQNVLKAE